MSWADSLSLSEILTEARQSLGFLQVEWRDVPERQRSMRAVFDASWQRLSEAEQVVFCQLSVFRGGFSREAASRVVIGAEATPHLLATLVRKSFLQHDQTRLCTKSRATSRTCALPASGPLHRGR
jgi:predicted ATPase